MNTSITKVSSEASPKGQLGQKYLASGISVSMRMWEEMEPGNPTADTVRDYETVGYVLKGRAVLSIGDQSIVLEPGDSWVVNKGQSHSYRILEQFTAIEATTPPANAHCRDEHQSDEEQTFDPFAQAEVPKEDAQQGNRPYAG